MSQARRPRFSDDDLLDASRAIFHERGYHRAQVEEIAERGGTTKPTIYARFGSKAELYRWTIERESSALLERMVETYEGSVELPWPRRLEVAMQAFSDFVEERPDGFELLFSNEAGAPAVGAGDAVLHELTLRNVELAGTLAARRGRHARESTGLLMAMAVGATRGCTLQALEVGADMPSATALAASFVRAGIGGVSSRVARRGVAGGGGC
jgi:AcrR family transcriptional regulator